MTDRFIEYRGRQVPVGWPERVQEAQRQRTVEINGQVVDRVRYGSESEDWGAETQPCHDCAALKGERHVLGCDAERCPLCEGQLFGCDCITSDEADDIPVVPLNPLAEHPLFRKFTNWDVAFQLVFVLILLGVGAVAILLKL